SSQDELGSVIDAYNRMTKQAETDTHNLILAREQAELAAETKTRFLANMSHELRTPLNAVIGITEMLREEAEDRQEDTEPHTRVAAAGRHLLGLIDNVLDFSKIEADKIELSPEPIELQSLLTDIIATTEPLALRNKNSLQLQTDDIPDLIYADSTRLRQIILNLLANACKFTENGSVVLKVERAPTENRNLIRFTVADTGIGISKEKCLSLFDEFSQADSSTTRQFGGTGLGLAISQRLCKLMKSRIEVDSHVGEGSAFSFVLPVGSEET
ncbi:MAG: hybrid sensor histidine kinase/response regulator, partial [Granulosicoccus sp.]|nr:hybrid sensor histidine kinase/response regulator [Granulosicoccus sp.]